jgi:hypothetical protein
MKQLSEFKRTITVSVLTALALAAMRTQPDAHAQNFASWGPAVSVDPTRVNGVNTPANDGCPIEAPDEHRLFLASDRSGNLDIWVAYHATQNDPWILQEQLPSPVNSSANDFCPTPLLGNGLLFVSARANVCGGATNNPDIYYSRFHPVFGWLPPQHLGCEVNSGFEEFSPSLVEAGGMTMLFFSSNRADGIRHKIYMSLMLPDGSWGAATLVGELNATGASDARPNVRKDGLEIVFDSTRAGGPPQIYTATRSSVSQPWSTPQLLGPNVNFPGFAQSRATISWDGTRLYFGSSRDNQPGDHGSDIFVSTRSGPGKVNQ